MINILIISTWYPNCFELTKGIFTKNIIEAQLLYTDCNIIIISPVPYFPKFKFKFIPEKFRNYAQLEICEQENGYTVYRPKYIKLPSPLSDKTDSISYYNAVLSLIKKQNISFDIIHSHGLYPDSFVAAKISIYFNKPLITHLHDSFIDLVYQMHPQQINTVFTTASKLIAVSKFQAQKTISLSTEINLSEKINVIYNGIPVDKINFQSETVHSKAPVKIVFAGTLNEDKGLSNLLKAIKIVSGKYNITLEIFGSGNREFYESLSKYLEIDSIVHFIGTIKNTDLIQKFSEYFCLVLPSKFETFGIVLIEAMAAGLPVVASNITAIPEIVSNDKVGILIEPNNIDSLVEGISRTLEQEWDRQIIHDHAIKFSLKNTAKQIFTIYNEILNTQK